MNCKSCRKRRALPPGQSVVQLCEECAAAKAEGFYGKEGESFAEIRARLRTHYANMVASYGYAR